MTKPPPPPRSPNCAPHEVTHAEINIAQAAPSSPMHAYKAPVTNLFGGSHGITLNKRPLIKREKSSHTPTKKKHGNPTRRASSVWARVAIQEALSADMRSLHVDNLFNACVESWDQCQMMIVTPDSNDNNNDSVNNSDNDIYNPASVANTPPKCGQRRFKIKTANQS
jgi:hypothetical protein